MSVVVNVVGDYLGFGVPPVLVIDERYVTGGQVSDNFTVCDGAVVVHYGGQRVLYRIDREVVLVSPPDGSIHEGRYCHLDRVLT
jgi:hypothetical protein